MPRSMERAIYDLFAPELLRQAMARFGLSDARAVELGRGNNFVFRISPADGSSAVILRLTHERQKTEPLLHGELDWMRFVASHGVATPSVLLSPTGLSIESFDDGAGGHFFGLLYADMGNRRYRLADLEPVMLRTWGDITARLHACADAYEPTESNLPATLRGDDWYYEFLSAQRHLPAVKSRVVDAYECNHNEISAATAGSRRNAMIHSDLHPGNFLRADAGPVLLDFDDAHVDHLEADLATVLLTLLDLPSLYPSRTWHTSRDQAFELFVAHFIPAYAQRANWADLNVDLINLLIRRRMMVLYIDVHRSRDVATLNERWQAILAAFEAEILDGTDFLSPSQLDLLKKPSDRA
jgi:Ser/Thr protein kinase RdoA (MazF antagonist)